MTDPLATRTPRPGVEQWRNPGNGVVVVQLHYTADPVKRDPAWQAKTFRSMRPRDRKREYEIDWSAPQGEAVIPEYNPGWHRQTRGVDARLRLMRFWDFGFDSPVCLFAQLSLEDQLRILDELCPFNTSLHSFVPMVNARTHQLLGAGALGVDDALLDVGGSDDVMEALGMTPTIAPGTFDAGDPAGSHRHSLGSEIEVLSSLGIQMHTIRPGTEESYMALRGRMQRQVWVTDHMEPALTVHPRCLNLHAALAGAFHRSDHAPYKPVKSHPAKDLVDALRYGNDNLSHASGTFDRKMREMANADIRDLRFVGHGA